MKNNQNISIYEVLSTSSPIRYNLKDNNYTGCSGSNPITTVSIDEESNYTLSKRINATTINLNFITPTSLLKPILIQIPKTSGTKSTQIYLKNENNIFTLNASTGQAITLGSDLGGKSVLKENKFSKFANLELIFLYFVLRLAGKHVSFYDIKDDRIKKAINSYWKY